MKILTELEEIKLVIVEMEVNLGKDKRKGLTLCAKDENGYYPLNTAHDGRPILMNKENLITQIKKNSNEVYRISEKEYEGYRFIDVRIYYQDRKTQEWY